jgi:hypothetical protein
LNITTACTKLNFRRIVFKLCLPHPSQFTGLDDMLEIIPTLVKREKLIIYQRHPEANRKVTAATGGGRSCALIGRRAPQPP